MAKQDDVAKLREQSRRTAEKMLDKSTGFPVPPRKAMSNAKKASKKLPYPLAPFPKANPMQMYRWLSEEWESLGRWKGLAAPFILYVALTTYEKERFTQDARQAQIDRAESRAKATELYLSGNDKPRRNLLGIIPLPGGR